MAKYIVCVGMGQTPAGVSEIQKEITAATVEVLHDGTLLCRAADGDVVATFKQYLYCLDDSQIPVVKPVRALHQ